MSDMIKEQLSAFIDDELSPSEAELLSRRFEGDPDLIACASRYHLIGSALRRERVVKSGFSESLATRIGAEPVLEAARASTTERPVVRAAIGVGIAASVALVAIAGLRSQVPDAGEGPAAPRVADSGPTADDTAIYTVPAATGELGQPPVVQQPRLVNYMFRHDRIAPSISRNGMNTRIIAAELLEPELAREDDQADTADAQR